MFNVGDRVKVKATATWFQNCTGEVVKVHHSSIDNVPCYKVLIDGGKQSPKIFELEELEIE
jgi:hypothetical protein